MSKPVLHNTHLNDETEKWIENNTIAKVKTKPINSGLFYGLSCPKCQCSFEYHLSDPQSEDAQFFPVKDLSVESFGEISLKTDKKPFRLIRRKIHKTEYGYYIEPEKKYKSWREKILYYLLPRIFSPPKY